MNIVIRIPDELEHDVRAAFAKVFPHLVQTHVETDDDGQPKLDSTGQPLASRDEAHTLERQLEEHIRTVVAQFHRQRILNEAEQQVATTLEKLGSLRVTTDSAPQPKSAAGPPAEERKAP